MFTGNKIFINQAKNVIVTDWIIRSRYSSEGFRVLCLDQSPFKRYFNRTRIPEYPAVEDLPLPSNIEDLVHSEKLKFSPQRSRDINGSYIKFSTSPISKFKETNLKIQEDERVQCYDCSGTINLSSAMQTNVPFPFRSRGKPTHLNMPGGQWAQNEKYTSEDLNNLHHLNSKHSTTNGGACTLGVKSATRNSFLCFSAMDLRTSDCFQFSFNVFSSQLRNFCSQNEKVENVSIHTNTKVKKSDVSQLSQKDKLKAAIKDYGGVDVGTIFKDWGVQEGATAAGTAAQFVVAYAIHKSMAPARIALTLSAAPFVVKKLRKIGILKAPQLKVK